MEQISLNSYSSLLKILNNEYKLNFNEISLHRDMIGYVYFLKSSTKKFVLKIYRPFNIEQALQSIDVIQHLQKYKYPVVSILKTSKGKSHITLSTTNGQCVAILFEYINGIEPNKEKEIIAIGKQVGELHKIMSFYSKPLINHQKDFFIDRFITILHKLQYCRLRIKELEQYGKELWGRMSSLPQGFCHGDLHTGNMLQSKANKFVLFDFDVASFSYSLIDVAILSDGTNFNNLTESAYDNTKRLFEKFYQGYSQIKTINDVEVSAIFDFIPIRHYELIATITDCQGLHSISQAFLDEQYEWLMEWREVCNSRRF